MKKSLLLTTLLTVLGTASSWAAFVTWDLNPGNLDQVVGSPTHTFTSAGFNLTATGYDHNTVGNDPFHQLFYKNEPMEGGAIERGLGLFNTNANELNLNPDGSVAHYIQFDLRSLLAQGFINGEIAVASMQNGEGFRLFGSNAAGTLGLQLPGTWTGLTFDDQFVSIPQFGSFQFISVAANSGRVLPIMFRVEPIPEMSALFPIVGLVTALGSTHVLRRRRLARQKASLS